MSWLKLKSAVMDAVCRRKLATPGEYSFVSKYDLFSRNLCIYLHSIECMLYVYYTPFYVLYTLLCNNLIMFQGPP